jgi:tetratricopeptide (TPR) repeat protein/multisubunit Na+/H+ antiporter MnhC subunit
MCGAPNAKVNADSRNAAGGWRVLAVAAILILAALGAYWNSFNVPFLFDDKSSISDNSSIRHLGQIGAVLSPPNTGTTAARPLLNLSFALNYAGGGLSVRGYHAVNLLIHICAGLVLFGIIRRTLLLPALRDRYGEAALPLAAFAALLWTLHPVQTEAVTYISQRAESLMGLFYLLTLYCFIRSVPSITGSDLTKGNEGNEVLGAVHGPWFSSLPSVKISGLEAVNSSVTGTGWLYLSVTACLCGMATKQVMVTAPVLVLLYDRAFVSRSFRTALTKRRWYYVSLVTTWLLLGFLMHRSSLAAVSVGFHAAVGWPAYALTELRVVTDYLKLALWPNPLVFDYGSEIIATHPLTVVPYALIITAILIGVAIAWLKFPMAGFLGCWFFLILAPTSTVVPIATQPMAESRMYLPLAAVVVLLTLWGYAFGRRRALVALGVIIVGLGALTARRNHDYRSEVSIWEDTVARQPQSSRGHSTLGVALAKIPGRIPEAIAHCEEALRLKPDYVEAHNGLAIVLTGIPGRLPDAIAHFEEALRLNPNMAELHNNLGAALAKVPGRSREAIPCYEKALRLNPDYAEAHYNLANALAKVPGQLSAAITHYEEALRLKPDYAEAHYNLALALLKIPGQMPAAVGHNEEAVRLKPGFVDARNNLAGIYAETGRLEAAIEQLEIAARLDPGSTMIRGNLEMLKATRK